MFYQKIFGKKNNKKKKEEVKKVRYLPKYVPRKKRRRKKSKPCLVVGISGATRSGKTSLLMGLQELYLSNVMLGDHYFSLEKIVELKNNWDHPEAIDHDLFLKEAKEKYQQAKNENCDFLIIEGFMLFWDDRMLDLLDIKIWLEIDRETCYTRRMKTKRVSENYFNEKLWPNYVEYNKLVKNKVQDLLIYESEDQNTLLSKVEKMLLDH
ncbi:hypothetical protein M0813_18421 [Anaeramoeba flamelloides]|uniref:Phosphoribulokinase/uridine kinase domain-containing protein n=1 Tax=Anaeramoeba flamelloides TaxID=1746091 RepID=A0ABQ8YT65_9EUKA|nr:hypothetical protein M0813_18421 [Anaeramoeba flamelloides]